MGEFLSWLAVDNDTRGMLVREIAAAGMRARQQNLFVTQQRLKDAVSEHEVVPEMIGIACVAAVLVVRLLEVG